MRTLKVLAAVIGFAFVLGGCAAGPGHVPNGFFFTSTKGPGDTGYRKAKAAKTGQSCGSNILGVVGLGDTSIDSAKKAGGIKKVATVDFETFSVLGAMYTKVCTNVTGD